MNNTNPYKDFYKEFSQNVAFAARTWHHHVHLNNRASEDENLLAALNKAARFWLDQRYSAVQTTVIFLGKIFEHTGNTFSVDKTIRSAYEGTEHFKKTELRKRKIASAGEFEGLDEYIEQASELSIEDIKSVSTQVKEAKDIWERIKPLRDKVYAHSEILSENERKALYEAVKNEDLTRVIQILLNVSHALWQAEANGRKPDFSVDHTQPIEQARQDIENLISSLLPKESSAE